jgi:hypothetical protein
MSFNTIGLGLTADDDTCGCLNFDPKLDDVYYARRIARPIIEDANFKTKYEINPEAFQTIDISKDCKTWCQNTTCLSINEWNENNKNDILKKYLKNFKNLKPQKARKDAVIIFKITTSEAKIKSSPSPQDHSHCDLYKTDNFAIQNLQVIEIIELENCIHMVKTSHNND